MLKGGWPLELRILCWDESYLIIPIKRLLNIEVKPHEPAFHQVKRAHTSAHAPWPALRTEEPGDDPPQAQGGEGSWASEGDVASLKVLVCGLIAASPAGRN